MQTTSPLNRRSSQSASQSASWRRRRCAAQVAHVSARFAPHLAQRRPVSAVSRALASLSAALAPVALAGLFLLAGSLLPHASAPLAQTHAATLSPSTATTAVDLAAFADMRAQTSAAVALRYQRGYSVQGSWLCYGWTSGAYHCTQHWYRASSGAYVSRNPGWVPSQTSGGAATTQPVAFASAGPSGISQWAYTGRAAYGEPSGGTQGYSWGWCTAGAAQLAHDYVGGLGNALDWTRHAAARGMATGTMPRAGATVVYAPGVQGAGGGGHVAHVVTVYNNGWFLSEDVNFFWNGGGWGRVSFRYAHAGAGVSFIY
jgi:surface antigen